MVLRIKDLRKSYGNVRALDGISLDLEGGKILCLVGPNGAGKTTLIRSIAGLVKPDSGLISVAGLDSETDPEGLRRVTGLVPDMPFIYERLTGREYIRLIASLYGSGTGKAEEYIRLFGMTRWIDSLAGGYSLGMRQKLALTGALIHDPKLIVLDEPRIGLDPPSAEALGETLRHEAKKNKAVLITTHILEFALGIATHIGVISSGKLIDIGPVSAWSGPDALRRAFPDANGDV